MLSREPCLFEFGCTGWFRSSFVMSRYAERVRKAVSRIAATQEKDLRALPGLERSLTLVLSVASNCYRIGILVRRLLYHLRIFHRTRLPVPVISVGNLTWGGTGKTPMVEYLARHFLAARVCPLILTRGYRGGDEVRLLQQHLQDTPTKFGVGANRARVALSILQYPVGRSSGLASILTSQKSKKHVWNCSEEAEIAILDDGMQHWALERDLEIVMVNAVSLWGNGRLVPRGPMRESLDAINRAHVVVLHHANLVSDESLKSIRQTLDPLLKKGSIVLSSHMRPLCFYRNPKSSDGECNSRSESSLQKVKDSVILCISAVACPESLARVLLQAGSDVKLKDIWMKCASVECQEGASHVERLDFSDHHKFEDKDLTEIGETFEQLQSRYPYQTVMLVTTEKDYMRDPGTIAQLGNLGDGVFVLHSSLEIIGGDGNNQSFSELLTTICCQQDAKWMRL